MNVPLGFGGALEMISLHPLFAHFPVVLLVMSFVFYLLGTLFKKASLLEAGKWTLWSGVLSVGAALWTGTKAGMVVPHDEETHQIMLLHQKIGYLVLFLSVGLGAWILAAKSALPRKGWAVFLTLSFVLTALVAQQADLGGRMVFLKGAGVGKKSMLSQSGHSHPHGTHEHE